MKLIFIYGPPAVGKLTVAEELVKLHDYRLFHNHLTLDLVRNIYPEFNQQMFVLADKLRMEVFEYAAKNNTDIVFTYVFDGEEYDKSFVAKAAELVREHNGTVAFVQLKASHDILLDRVAEESRGKFHKLKDKNILKAHLGKSAKDPVVPFEDVLVIDTEEMSAQASASHISKHFSL